MSGIGDSAQFLSLASYNIHRCFGTDRKYLPERIAEVVQALDAEVVALQEVDLALLVDGRTQIDFLAGYVRMTAVPGPNADDHRAQFGNALLTRLPIRRIREIDLSVRRFEPRGALDVELDLDGRHLRMIATHLGLNAAERRLQVRHLLRTLNEHRVEGPCVLIGDFNEWRPVGGSVRALDQHFGPALPLRSFPSRFPLLPLDRIWVWPRPTLRVVGTYATPLTRVASDHLPIRAVMGWPVADLGSVSWERFGLERSL